MYDCCIWCEKHIHESPEPFCCDEHKRSWFDAEHEQEKELERDRDERMEDPNAGCWSYQW
jgi:CDGSH-type Zn-finger protein